MALPSIDRRQLLLAGLGAAALPPAFAQATGGANARVVKLLVGFPAGQATDLVARALIERLQPLTGDNYIVDNRPGQGGGVALGQLAKSAPNGTTAMLAHMSALCTAPHTYKSVPFDTLKDFESAGLVGDLPFVLVCNPQVPVQNMRDLVAYARSNPDKLTNASSGNGTVSHLAMEEIKRRAGLKITHVPYKGSVAGLTDVIAGNVSMALETASAVRPHVESGRLRAIAAGSGQRLGGVFATLPTLIEQGFPDLRAVTWLMLLYPAGTPKPFINQMHTAITGLVRTPEMDAKLTQIGLQVRTSASPAEADEYMRTEFRRWGEIVRLSGLERE